jgi:predicted ferric reductase
LITGNTPFSAQQHPLTISSSAELGPERGLELSVKALGDWSRESVPNLAAGTRAWVDGPFGIFSIDRAEAPGFIMIAGGIGITPMRSMLLSMRDRGDVRPVVLIFAARNRERAVFIGELEALAQKMPLRLVPVYEAPPPDWGGERGFVTKALLQRHLPPQYLRWQHFVCGPGPMMDSVERSLSELGVPPERVRTERFDMV